MSLVLSILANPKALAGIGLALILAFAGVQTARLDHAKGDLKQARAALAGLRTEEAAAAQRARVLAARQTEVGAEIGARSQKAEAAIHAISGAIHREVPHAVPASVDSVLPRGWVRLHDAAALGLPPVPPASLAVDAAPSGLEASDALGAVVDNYDACHANAQTLSDLQDWVRQAAAR